MVVTLYAMRCACMSSCSVWEIDCSSCASAEYGWLARFLAWLISIVAWFSRLWISLLTCCSSRAAVRTFCEKLVGSKTIHCALSGDTGGRERQNGRARGERRA